MTFAFECAIIGRMFAERNLIPWKWGAVVLERFCGGLCRIMKVSRTPAVRKAYGTFSSVVGICCNVVLFLLKYVMGSLSHSIAIVSDAFNNLSDCASCLITMFGYKLAAKPADKGHPFGHGRMEYLTSLVIAVMIALMGFELLRNSVERSSIRMRCSFAG